MKQYMVIEFFKPGRYEAIYDRFNRQGRMLPDGLDYLNAWVSRDKNVCFQLMETDNEELFAEWFNRWNDLMSFEVYPIDQ